MKAVVLGGGADQCTLIDELKKRAFSIVLIDYYQNPPAKTLVDKHYITSTLNQEAVLEICLEEKPDRIITACTDQALLTVAYVSEKLGLYWPFTYEQALQTTNKVFMKSAFITNNIPTSNFLELTQGVENNLKDLQFPLVVKPADSNGSFGIRKVNNYPELEHATTNAFSISRSKKAIVEEYIKGKELSIDAFVKDGDVYILLITETNKIPSSGGAFPISESRYPVDLSEEIKKELKIIIKQISVAFNLDNTPLLVQAVINDEKIYILEFGVRIAGGSKHHLIKMVTGFDVMNAFVSSIFLESFNVQINELTKYAATIYIYGKPGTFAEIIGLERLIKGKCLDAFFQYKTFGSEISGSIASRDRIGACITRATSKAELIQKICNVDKTIKVLDNSGKDIMLHGIYSNY